MVDWNGELEAVHTDGRVVPVTLAVGCQPADGMYELSAGLEDGGLRAMYFMPDGQQVFNLSNGSRPWTIRNRQPEAESPPKQWTDEHRCKQSIPQTTMTLTHLPPGAYFMCKAGCDPKLVTVHRIDADAGIAVIGLGEAHRRNSRRPVSIAAYQWHPASAEMLAALRGEVAIMARAALNTDHSHAKS